MTSDAPLVNQRTRERWLSTKFNRSNDLHVRNMLEALHGVYSDGTNKSGVIAGLQVSIVAASFDIAVSPGLAQLQDSSVPSPDSSHRWIELTVSATATVPASDPVNPRWDVVEIQPGTSQTNVSRDIFQPTTGSFTPSVGVDEQSSSPAIRVRSGTAAASPVLPAGDADWMPLAYIYVPAASVTLDVNDYVLCRPMMGIPHPVEVQGGGMTFISTHSGTDLQLDMLAEGIEGRFENAGFSFSVSGRPTLTLDADSFDGGSGVPVAADVHYGYYVPAPYPAGYDTSMALREFTPGSSALSQFSSHMVAGFDGCLFVMSQQAPDVDTLQGAPSSAGNFTITNTPFGVSVTVDRSLGVYAGSCFSPGTAGFGGQISNGEEVDIQGLSGSPFFSVSSVDTPAAAVSCWEVGGNRRLPDTAHKVRVRATFTASSTAAGTPILTIADESHIFNGVGTPFYRWAWDDSTDFQLIQPVDVTPDRTNGNIEVGLLENGTSGTYSANLVAEGYRDAILARR